MIKNWIDMSANGWARVIILTALGTATSIAVALAFDSYSFSEGWRWGGAPWNNVIIPLMIAPPFFFYLLNKLRQLAIANDMLLTIASTDGLTACLNRVAFTTLVDAYLERVASQADKRDGALLVIDVDNFKGVNDRFGHDIGDEALKLVVRNMKTMLRDVDLIGRMGGEEFGVFLPGVSPGPAEAVAERIRASVKASDFVPDGVPCDLSISVGVATFTRSTSFTELYKIADKRLYEAKQNGRNRVHYAPTLSAGWA